MSSKTFTIGWARGGVTAICAALMALFVHDGALAQQWPSKPITIISPFAPGNATDTVARIVADQLAKDLGQPLVVENKTGAGGTIGANAVARAAPDGYTILSHGASHLFAPFLHKTLPYDVLADFVPVVPFGYQPMVLVASAAKGYKTLQDLLAAARAKPGSLNFASAGIGSASHMAAERLRLAAKFEAQHVPFRGPVDALGEVIAGRVDFYFVPSLPALGQIRDGKVRALAVSTPKRASILPDVPTTLEAGVPDSAYYFWGGMFAPAKTPREVVAKLNAMTVKALNTPAVRERLTRLGVEPMNMNPEQFNAFVLEEYKGLQELAKAADIRPQ